MGLSTSAVACHEGGAMGFASGNINGLIIDIISIPTFAFASSSGTSGCKNWEFADITEQERYIVFNWDRLSQESAQGSGKSIEAFAILSQCTPEAYPYFQRVMHQNYQKLFTAPLHSPKDSQMFLHKIQQFIGSHPQLSILCLSSL